jgi:rhodanese-related sulfurtransferase
MLNNMKEQQLFYEQKLNYEMDAWDLNDARVRGENICIIDARSGSSFENEHITGAINLHHKIMNEANTSHLDKSALYVVYCTGIGCNASTKGALNMVKLGFRVKELIGGLEWWKRDGYETQGTNVSVDKCVACNC